ncbi:MAG: hypothetical protein J6N45_00140 [Alphaproteobacteria bacterium]|nr:hypothetical protein [Alphaproteobacteria bacterium]
MLDFITFAQSAKLPIYFIGVGEQIEDLGVFNAHDYALNLLDFYVKIVYYTTGKHKN